MSSPANISCASCHQTGEALGHALKRCGRCKSVNYCGQQCQKDDRPRHRSSCRSGDVNATPNPIHTTLGTSMEEADNGYDADAGGDSEVASTGRAFNRCNTDDASVNSSNAGGPALTSTTADIIYHLQISVPRYHYIRILGPYRTIEELVRKASLKFADEFKRGIETLHDFPSQGRLGTWEHGVSLEYDNSSSTDTISVLREHNPTIAARLPGPTWSVVCGDIFMDGCGWADEKLIRRLGLDSMPVMDKRVYGTFGDVAAADEAARIVVQAMIDRTEEVVTVQVSRRDGRYSVSVGEDISIFQAFGEDGRDCIGVGVSNGDIIDKMSFVQVIYSAGT